MRQSAAGQGGVGARLKDRWVRKEEDQRQRRGFVGRERVEEEISARARERQLRSLELKVGVGVGVGRAATRSVAMGSCLPCGRLKRTRVG